MDKEKLKSADFEILETIGVDKIRRDTNLDTSRILDILEKRFDKIDYVRAKGFINILEKEYCLDLSVWLEEYRLFHPIQDNLEKEKQVQKQFSEKVKRKKHLLLVCMIGILCAILFVAIGLFSESFVNRANPLSEASQSTEIQAQNNINDKPVEELSQPNNHDEMISNGEGAQKQAKQPDQELSISKIGTPIFKDIEIAQEDSLSLEFERPIWVGVIDLQNKKKKEEKRQDYQISLDRDLLIYIAYGTFIASIGQNEEVFKTYEPVFLIYTKEHGLKRLTKTEYLFANGGAEW